MSQPQAPCPLCGAPNQQAFNRDKQRSYLCCLGCDLVHVPAHDRPNPEQERARYELHQNHPHDLGYQHFLRRLLDPLLLRLPPAASGLDFGSGPTAVLASMLESEGHSMTLWDPCFAPNSTALEGRYDFITATEVLEHLHNPGKELKHLWTCLKPGGLMAIMTALRDDTLDFSRWYYKNDPTHVCFYSHPTLHWLGKQWGSAPEFIASQVIFFAKLAK